VTSISVAVVFSPPYSTSRIPQLIDWNQLFEFWLISGQLEVSLDARLIDVTEVTQAVNRVFPAPLVAGVQPIVGCLTEPAPEVSIEIGQTPPLVSFTADCRGSAGPQPEELVTAS
jgi:hypothetical protein